MAKQTEFQRQLSDPRWQKKRLQILERDEWTCKRCGDTETTLTVHHKSYRMEGGKFVDYWDYHDDDLITFCTNCHEEEEIYLKRYAKQLPIKYKSLCDNSEAIFALSLLAEALQEKLGRRINIHDIAPIHGFIEGAEYGKTN